ncbi:MAG TPA: hypothetical protein VLZ83_03680 [Edaphocola sp.]|nr:hypothetical protein [Edaphocola sp.]
MQDIEPYYNWRHFYKAEEDPVSPYYGNEHSEFEFKDTVYNYYIHPQWDSFGSSTLYLKVLFTDYEEGTAIIEFIGEWNDAIENDIMMLKRNIIDEKIYAGISKFVLIVENVMNYHSSDDSYYEEWLEDVSEKDGWIVLLNISQHLKSEFNAAGVFRYVFQQEYLSWRTLDPAVLIDRIENNLLKRIG